MRNKKGSVHIDWVVSIALLLTVMVVLLGFIKPGYEPKFEGDVLLKMVEEEFNKRAEWNVSKTMLSFDCDGGGVVQIDLGEYIPNYGKFKVINKDKNAEGNTVVAKYKGSLTIDTTAVKKFWVIHNRESGYDVSPDDPGDVTGNCEEGQVGAANAIIFKGIRNGKLGMGSSKLDLPNWSFPTFRFFRIKVLKPDGNYYDSRYCFAKLPSGIEGGERCKEYKIPDEVEVYSVNKGTNILKKDVDLLDKPGVPEEDKPVKQVILNIEVW